MQQLYKSISSFLMLQQEELAAFEQIFSPLQLKKGQFLARAGRVERNFAFIKSGLLRAYFTTSDGVEYNKTFFVADDFAGGYSSLVTGGINQINIQALEDTLLLSAPYKELLAVYDRFSRLERLGRVIAEQYFVAKEKREIDLVTLDAEQRYRLFQQEYPGLENRIAQYHIASYLGITPTQLSRIRARRPESSLHK